MKARVLGSAAGGGSPQWNCHCDVCTAVRSGAGHPRTQSSLAVTVDDRQWFLFNASPDVRTQVDGLRLSAVLLTDAELDHTAGLLLLREADVVELYATPAVYETLHDGSGLLPLLARYCRVEWRPVDLGVEFVLAPGLSCRAFDVPTTKRDRFGVGVGAGRVVGYRITDTHSGGTLVYLPGAQALPSLDPADVLLFDGSFFRDDEMGPARTARDMGHLPILDSLEPLSGFRRVIYVHINNTNPILLDDSPERRAVEARGLEVAMDGLEIEL
ncbi:pyrroloquinoline quinone biosynthesis protein PqqB [Cryptosporangium phraense]|uniref:Coenzyme PQQ synthesis protein B n=1 Tax=Cryptosporangium phraense TaxID=2593070 RepID=A0A545ARG8_9ACTN|nr:MBL fold metallo-hydrolase [Cryptosporangium phraense]TQS43934.1 pyrroloquinoline quinone biosynthesis protein PqqB [Cryptosporangium phraense]